MSDRPLLRDPSDYEDGYVSPTSDRGRLLSTADVVAEFYLPSVKTLLTWRYRGLLAPVSPGWWWELDVADAERATRRAPRVRRLNQLATEDEK